MQGWGQVFNQCSLLILLMIFHSGDTQPPFSARTAQATYRVQFGLAVLVHLWLFYHRLYKVHDADVQLRAAKRKQNTSGYDMQSLRLLNAHYWGRLVATAGAWFANDVRCRRRVCLRRSLSTDPSALTRRSSSTAPRCLRPRSSASSTLAHRLS